MVMMREHASGKLYLQACDTVIELGKKGADEVACTLLGRSHYLTRYANNQVIQNVRKNEIQMVVRVAVNGKVGMASCNQLDTNSLERTVTKAVELAKYLTPDPHFQGFADPEAIPSIYGFDEATEQVTPEQMTKAVKVIADQSHALGLEAAGACQIVLKDQAVANSRGVRLYGRHSRAELHAVVMSESSSGYAVDTKTSFFDLNPTEVARVAIDKCLDSKNPKAIEIGAYPVILEPKAVADLLAYLAFSGINPIAYHEGRSFLSGRMREQIFDERISIAEDPLYEQGLPFAFDWDGKAKQRVPLIEQGKVVGMIYDDYTAKRYGMTSTGNALLPGSSPFGILPTHLRMSPGETSVEDMIKQTKRGILVTRFHYLGIIDAKRTIMTGMTRDGTFLIEDGQVVAPLKNLRMTQSIEEAFNHIEAVGNQSKTFAVREQVVSAPALKINQFHFTGLTEH